MCGIAGLVASDLASEERSAWVERMLARLAHRGPSGRATLDRGGCALGIARLAIVAPGQPAAVFSNELGDVHAVVNGEVYDHAALRVWLRARGHEIADGPDTAIVPHLWEEHGDAFPAGMDGMFAVALWSRARQELTLARDRAGEKPLFVCEHAGRFAFASEVGALLALPWVDRAPDAAALARYLVHGCFTGEETAYAAIRQLPPAHVLTWRGGRTDVRRYWRPWDALARGGESCTVRAAPAATLAALREAVASRVPGDVPFGVFLSGGVDSGLVAALAARAVGHAFPTFSLRLPPRGYDESGLAAEVARRIGSEHVVVTLDVAAGERALDRFARTMDQPLGDPSLLPTWALAEAASRRVPVVLTGEGGDELFAGYPTYAGHRHAAWARHVPGPARDALLALARRFRPRHHHVTLAHLVERFLGTSTLPAFERHLAWWGTARPAEARALLAPELRRHAGDPLRAAHRIERQLLDAGVLDPSRPVPAVAYQLLDFETYLPGDLLTKVDRCTMAHGVESRAPFLRPALIEFALALPDAARVRGVSGKWALKRAAEHILPREILARRKQGFSPPFSAWARGPMRGLVLDALSRERVRAAGVLDPDAVVALVQAHLSAREDRGRTLWAVLSLQMWAERRHIAVTAALSPAAAPR